MNNVVKTLTVAGLLTGLLTGCGSSSTSATSATSTTSTASTANTTTGSIDSQQVGKVDSKTAQATMKADAGSVSLKLTETANLKGVLFAVNGVRNVKGDQDHKPAEGKRFINIDFSLKNTTDTPQLVLPIENLQVKLADGTVIKSYTVTLDQHGDTWAGLNPGSFMQGEFTYEVPTAANEFDVTFSPNINMGSASVHVTGADIK